MKHKHTQVVKQGRNSVTIVSTKDDETGIETKQVVAKRGKRTTRTVVEYDMATGQALTVDGHPLPLGDTLYAKFTNVAVKLLDDLAKRDPDALSTA